MSDAAIAFTAAFVFFVVPTVFCAWAFLLAVRDRKRADAAEEQPMGDATDTPSNIHQIRRVNWRRENEDA